MAIVGWILLFLLGIVLLLLFTPIRIKAEYIGRWRVRVMLLGVIPVFSFPFSAKAKDKPEKPTPSPTEKTPAKEQAKKPSILDDLKALFREEGISGVLSFFKKLARLLKTTLSSLSRFITIRKLALCVRVGGEEADETAVQYGRISAALAASLAVLSKAVRLKKPNIRVIPDFTRDQTEMNMRMIVWVWPFGVVGTGISALCKLVALWFKTMKTPNSVGVENKTQNPALK